ncbi:MAG TPA: hypothetical protein VIJ55_09050 [Acetobacteraceae bacterium]
MQANVAIPSSARPTDYFLDHFVAHKLASVTECGAPELSTHGPWLTGFVLTSTFRAKLPSDKRAYVFNFLRKAENAISHYKEARNALLEYVATPRTVISPYFRSLSNLETCTAQCFQGFRLLSTGSQGSKKPFYKENDGSDLDRLRVIHYTSKHMDERIENGEIPDEATAPIWITNNGIEAYGKKAVLTSLSFAELAALLISMSDLANKLSKLEPKS